ncbi:MAG: sensor histidine kinase, partial [Flavobacteriaceae bacterium]
LDLADSLAFRRTNQITRDLASSLNDSTRLANAHWDLAHFFDYNTVSTKDSAYFHYAVAQEIFKALGNDLNAGKMLYNIASIQNQIKDYTGAEVNTIKAIEILKFLSANELLYDCYNVLAITSKDQKEYDRALDYYKTAESYLEKIDQKKTNLQTLENNIGNVYQELQNHPMAISYYEKVLEKDSVFYKDPQLYARALNNLAYNRMKAGQLEGVETQFRQALHIRDSIQDVAGMAASHYNLAEYYLLEQDSLRALEEAKKARTYAENSVSNDRLLQSLGLLARADPKHAVEYSQAYIQLSDSLQQLERRERDKFARIRFETNETIAQNKLLAQQKRLWTGIALTLLLLAVAAYIIIVQRIKNQKLRFQRAQQASNEKIFNLLLSEGQKLEEGKKLEQKRISEELHDGVQGRLQGVRMILLGLNKRTTPEAIAERAEAIKELMDIQEEVRSISHELSNAAYQNLPNFINSIQELLKGLEVSAHLKHSFEYDRKTDWDALRGDLKINLYRVLQESLQNCVKHAQAQHVSLAFMVEGENSLLVTLRDDGRGFDVKKGKTGIGLRNISARVSKMEGVFDIDSTPGKGTTITITLPIRKYDEETDIYIERSLQKV